MSDIKPKTFTRKLYTTDTNWVVDQLTIDPAPSEAMIRRYSQEFETCNDLIVQALHKTTEEWEMECASHNESVEATYRAEGDIAGNDIDKAIAAKGLLLKAPSNPLVESLLELVQNDIGHFRSVLNEPAPKPLSVSAFKAMTMDRLEKQRARAEENLDKGENSLRYIQELQDFVGGLD